MPYIKTQGDALGWQLFFLRFATKASPSSPSGLFRPCSTACLCYAAPSLWQCRDRSQFVVPSSGGGGVRGGSETNNARPIKIGKDCIFLYHPQPLLPEGGDYRQRGVVCAPAPMKSAFFVAFVRFCAGVRCREGNKKEAMCYGLLGVCAAINR